MWNIDHTSADRQKIYKKYKIKYQVHRTRKCERVQPSRTPFLQTIFSTETSELPEYIAKNAINVSGVQVGDVSKGGDVIYNEYGSINTGHIPGWKSLTFKY